LPLFFIWGDKMAHSWWDLETRVGKGYKYICGVDEVGWGALCSSIVSAAVILKPEAKELDIKDSKKLSQKKREELAKVIPDYCVSYSISEMDSVTIDEKGIQYCNMYVLDNAARKVCKDVENCISIIDGRPLWKSNDFSYHFEEKADNLSRSVAAASIIAKVYRDNILIALHEKYPEYNFAQNKGYGTKEHMEAIERFGIIPGIHRTTFLNKFAYNWSAFFIPQNLMSLPTSSR